MSLVVKNIYNKKSNSILERELKNCLKTHEILVNIFQFLKTKEIASSVPVCKSWLKAACNKWSYSSLCILDNSFWLEGLNQTERSFLNKKVEFEKEAASDKGILQNLKKVGKLEEGKLGCALIIIPRGLTVSALEFIYNKKRKQAQLATCKKTKFFLKNFEGIKNIADNIFVLNKKFAFVFTPCPYKAYSHSCF